MEQSSSTHVVIQTTRSTSIQSFCTKLLIRCHHHHVPPNPFALLDTPLLREPTHLPPLALILYSDRTVQYRPQHDVIDQYLTCCWCVRESEWHNQILVVSVSGSEGCLLFFFFFHVYQVVYFFQVQLGEDCSLADPVSQFVRIWQQISVFDSNIVEFPVIHTKSKTSVFLWCK